MLNETLYQKLLTTSKNLISSGPRYTSYPTVPEWKNWNSDDYLNILENFQGPEYSLYLHFPYCKTKCLFCACNAYISNNKVIRSKYLDHLSSEIDMHRPYLGNKSIRHLHLGGGTPTFIEESELNKILEHLFNNYSFKKTAEKSVEIDPRTITKNKLKILHSFGFNRVSFGIQDFDPNVQSFIHRQHTVDEISDILEMTRNTGINNINLDIIYGLNFQTTTSWSQTLSSVLKLKPSRIAAYSFANVPWKKKHQLGLKDGTVTSEEKIKMLLMTREFFMNNGYIAVGIDHFALPNDPLAVALKEHKLYRNFMGYTDDFHGNYFGFGCSSIGWTPQAFYQNIVTPIEYEQKISSGTFATFKGKLLSEDDKIRQTIIQEIMNYSELQFSSIEKIFQINFQEYFENELAELKKITELLTINSDGFTLTEVGTYFTRNIAMIFDAYLQKSAPKQFSATI